MRISLIIPAAGIGKRMKSEINKQYLLLQDQSVLAHTIKIFHQIAEIEEIIIVAAEDELTYCKEEVVDKYKFSKVKKIVAGGAERQDSVYQGFLASSPLADYLIIHDGARPFLKEREAKRFIQALKKEEALVMGVPEKNTLKEVMDSYIIHTIPRTNVWEIQTPQGFRRDILAQAFKEAEGNFHSFTDDSSMVEKLNLPVKIFKGNYLNIKITSPEDIKLGKAILEILKEEG